MKVEFSKGPIEDFRKFGFCKMAKCDAGLFRDACEMLDEMLKV
jgi:hypothetical protein